MRRAGVDRAEQPAGARPRQTRTGAPPRAAEVGQVAGPLAAGPEPARSAGGGAARARPGRRAPRACAGPNIARSSSVSGSSAAAARRCGAQHVGVVRVEHRRLDRLAEHAPPGGGRGRCRAGRRARPAPRARSCPARPARPACCHSDARVPGQPAMQHGVQPADVDAELEGVGRRDAEDPARLQVGLERAPLLGQVAGAVGRDAARRARGRPRPAAAASPATTVSAPRRERTKASVRAPVERPGRPAGSATSAVAVRRTGASVLAGQLGAAAAPTGRTASRPGARRRRSTAATGRPVSRLARTSPGRPPSPRRGRRRGRRRSGAHTRRSRRSTAATCEPKTPR